jgi:hypothetical protein
MSTKPLRFFGGVIRSGGLDYPQVETGTEGGAAMVQHGAAVGTNELSPHSAHPRQPDPYAATNARHVAKLK